MRFSEPDRVRRALDLGNLDSDVTSVPHGVALGSHVASSNFTSFLKNGGRLSHFGVRFGCTNSCKHLA